MTFTNPIYSILYLDKEKESLAAFKSAFSRDYHVFTAASGSEGLEIMERSTIQLVIAFQRLSDMSGIEFLEVILRDYPDSMRMIMTGEDDTDAIIEAVNRGNVYRYVARPWNREELLLSIDSAMEVYNLKVQNRNLIDSLEEAKLNLEMKVMERTRQIEQQRQNITDSIQYASRIQSALMQPSEELDQLMPVHFILNKPKDIVSGDFYWVSKKGGRLIMAVADCTGHGVPGAFMSILGMSFLNEILNYLDNAQTGEILDELRSQVIKALGQTGDRDEAREGMEMALCAVDFDRHMIQFSGASRPLYMARGGELKVIKGDHMPIGIYDTGLQDFTSREVPFEDGDIIYLFTDGYVDQIGGLERKTFRSVRLKKLLGEICTRPLEEQKAILLEEHEVWRAGREQIDDIMVLGVKL